MHDVVVVALHVVVAADVARADLVAVAAGHQRVADVAARGHRAVAGRGGGVRLDVLCDVAAVGVDLLVHRVVDVGVAVVDEVVRDVAGEVLDRLAVALAVPVAVSVVMSAVAPAVVVSAVGGGRADRPVEAAGRRCG